MVDATALVKKTGAVAGDPRREDFTLQENEATQEIIYFSLEALPLSVVSLPYVGGASVWQERSNRRLPSFHLS